MDTITENWKDISGYEGLYQVSDLGRIKSLPKQRGYSLIKESFIIKQCIDVSGYFIVGLHKQRNQILLFYRFINQKTVLKD
jgi:hypothetical protein